MEMQHFPMVTGLLKCLLVCDMELKDCSSEADFPLSLTFAYDWTVTFYLLMAVTLNFQIGREAGVIFCLFTMVK